MAFWNKKKEKGKEDGKGLFSERDLKKRVNEIKLSKVIASLLFIVVGLVLIIWSEPALTVICTIIGVLLCATGVVAVVMYFVAHERGFMGTAMLSMGVVIAVVGLYLALNPAVLATVVPAIIGILILVSGIINLSETVQTRKEKGEKQVLALILSLITVVLGILIIINPSALNKVILVLMGISLIYDGVSNLVIIAGVNGMVKAAKQEISAVETTAQEVADEEEHTYTEVKRPSAQEADAEDTATYTAPAADEKTESDGTAASGSNTAENDTDTTEDTTE